MSPQKKDRCRAYYRTMRMSYFRYRKKIKFRYKETFHDSFNLTVEEWCRIWNEAQDVFCTDTMQLHRPWDVKTKSPLTKKGAWFSKVDPEKYNYIFAQTELDAQNFWVQIAVDCTARRKMSAKQIPNL